MLYCEKCRVYTTDIACPDCDEFIDEVFVRLERELQNNKKLESQAAKLLDKKEQNY